MKKIYESPVVQVVKVELQQMIAESLGIGETVTDASGAESRGFDWDDED